MMQDKTPIYMMIIVGMVALVGIVVMLTTPATTVDTGITGNAVFESDTSSFSIFGKVFFTLFLLGVAGYMYFKSE
jgi:uncharacterized membrane-anchored protein YitT (DUF2179 family)